MAEHRVERQLLEAILEGMGGGGPEPLIRRVLEVATAACGAQRGYLAVQASDDPDQGMPRWWTAVGFEQEDIDAIRAAVSTGVLREAIRSGKVVLSSSALTDPRFQTRNSVQLGRIEAVLAARVGEQGVLYLQGATAGQFGLEERGLMERLVVWLAPLVDRVAHFVADPTDPTAAYRAGGRFDAITGRSRAIADLLQRASAIASVDVPVLITGETGTGKSVLAHSLHQASARADKPFVTVNAAAIPDTLLEAELFGAEPGAYSGAVQRVIGRVGAAEGGTLFLDEVGELSSSAQAKLLLFAQDGQYTPLGTSTPRCADVRLITATNASLEDAVKAERFRMDLLHRLDVLRLRMPTLRERIEDIPLLVEDIGRRLAARHGLRWAGVEPAAIAWIQSQPWPGNVRELTNVLERVLILARPDGALTVEQVQAHGGFGPASSPAEGLSMEGSLQDTVRAAQRQRILAALAQAGGVMKVAAELLGVSRSRLYELCNELDIPRS